MLKKLVSIMKRKDNSQIEMQRFIYDMFYSKVYKAICYITRDPDITQDILQETFIKAFKNLDSIKDPEKMGAWLTTIAVRTTKDYYNKHNKSNNNVSIDSEVFVEIKQTEWVAKTVEKSVELSTLKEQLAKKIDELPPEYREVFVLKYYAELTYEEISEVLDLKVGTVKSRIHRAKQKLQIEIKQDPGCIGGEMLEL
ncbi:RNA polymerase sigma factor [Desulfuribacillus alkaliarsenatis]|uniref:RNA polymerase sigma factor n=1 Tax=Desulfuribacillus alkaliarsenatis TaxID=766136 RepID=A0A1E5FZW9_9FIRM|nr:sigma-70 family RNA polymerase sigma factor [Desulfuribacillus alkaliarsenatis]OEF96127.1 hypothetical protein BHF68_10370 [Desulfuribacillus alkaliarsenatis]